VFINFPILATAPPGAQTITLINNSSGHTQIVGSNGTYTLSPAPPYSGTINVVPLPLQVVPGSLVGTPSGFSLQFNQPILVNSTTPVLYGQGFGASAPVPSVTLTQTKDAGGNPVDIPVQGSLVFDPTSNALNFVSTNTALLANNGSPLLPDGVYTVDLTSSAASNGFQAASGGFLDGLDNGTPGSGDYTATFPVNAAAAHDDAVWIPPTADGPGQALSAPGNNQVGGGYPVYLSDPTGTVTSVQVTLNYNPALLAVSGVTGPGFALLGTSTPGQAVLEYSGPALPAGTETPIGFLLASVPAGTSGNPTPYRAKDLMHLSGVLLNGGAVPVVTGDAVHLVAYVGDADGNGAYTSNDAVLITRVTLQTDTGFAAYPLVDPVIVADTDGAGFIPADAPYQVNEAAIGYPTATLTNPPVPPGVVFQPVADRVVRAQRISHNLQVVPTAHVPASMVAPGLLLTGLLLPLETTPLVSLLDWARLPLGNLLFQYLERETTANDPIPPDLASAAIERVLASPWLLALPNADEGEWLSWMAIDHGGQQKERDFVLSRKSPGTQ
jgi:hypothetical protein